jgi:arabinose-5-phosphate isomerase
MTNIKDSAIQCIQDEAQALLDLIPALTDDFEKAVEFLSHCKGKVIVTGIGKSGHIGAKIAATLASTGTPSFFVNPVDALHGDLGMINAGDIVIAISNSGQTDELLRVIPFLLNRNIPIIAMSGNPDSLLAQYATCHITVKVKKEACPLNLAPTSSTTAALAIGDAIACALINLKGFKEQDYAQFHPGGSLGKRLLTKVKDVMRQDNLPIVSLGMPLSDAIIHISKEKLGLAIVMRDEILLGVITDGDIRRAIQKSKSAFFELSVQDIMTKAPKKTNLNSKIEDAEIIMNDNKIHALIVVDNADKLVGVIDEFACRI